MNAPVALDVLLLREETAQSSLPLATPGVQRWVWEGRFGRMLIEVAGGDVFVNNQRVEPHTTLKPLAGAAPMNIERCTTQP